MSGEENLCASLHAIYENEELLSKSLTGRFLPNRF